MSAQRGAPRPEELTAEAISSALLNVRVAGIGIVKSYDAAKKTCDVQPAIRRPLEDEDGTLHQEADSIVTNVMVAHWGTSALSVHSSLAAGDAVLLVYLDYSPAMWRQRGTVSDAADTHKNGPSYPVAIPFLRPSGGPAPDSDESIGIPDGLRIHFTVSHVIVGEGSDAVAMAAKVNARLDAIEDSLAAIGGHVHSGVTAGAASSGPPVGFTPGGGDVSSANLKAD